MFLSHTGGALLGSLTVATVTIAKSDYPNGRFSILGQAEISVANPTSRLALPVTISRTEGVLGQQTVSLVFLSLPSFMQVCGSHTNEAMQISPLHQ